MKKTKLSNAYLSAVVGHCEFIGQTQKILTISNSKPLMRRGKIDNNFYRAIPVRMTRIAGWTDRQRIGV